MHLTIVLPSWTSYHRNSTSIGNHSDLTANLVLHWLNICIVTALIGMVKDKAASMGRLGAKQKQFPINPGKKRR